jgi:hypothetical protein
MPHKTTTSRRSRTTAQSGPRQRTKAGSRYTVGLDRNLANEVARYARTTDMSMSKAISALVRLGLEGQEMRKREFFGKLKENLANDDPDQQDRMVDEFRTLILGR